MVISTSELQEFAVGSKTMWNPYHVNAVAPFGGLGLSDSADFRDGKGAEKVQPSILKLLSLTVVA